MMFALPPDPYFHERIAILHENVELERKQTETEWGAFRWERGQDFIRRLREEGFSTTQDMRFEHWCGRVEWRCHVWTRETEQVDAIQLIALRANQTGRGNRLLRHFCRAMDKTKHGITCIGVVRPFDYVGGVLTEDKQRGKFDTERLLRWYGHFGFLEHDDKSPEGRPVVVRTSSNYKPNPYPFPNSLEAEQGRGVVGEMAATVDTNTPRPAHSPEESINIALNRGPQMRYV